MSSEWHRLPFGEFISLQRGHDLPEQDREDGNVPILGSFGITGWHSTAKAKAPGLTIGRSGASFGVATYTDKDYFPLNTTLYVTDFNGNDPRFAYYFAKNFDFTAFNSGSAQPSLNRNFINPVEVSIPPLPEQKAIAHILGTLDDKIELNRKTNETLEAMAKALFKSWFVDFDPVRAKAEGRPTGLPDEISDLFPDSFEDSELGEIPSGWRTGSLDEIAMNPRETAKPEEMDSTDRYIGLEHMPRGSICLGESGEAEELESNKNRFREGDILYGKLRPYFKKTGFAQFDGVCSTDIVVTRKKGSSGAGFICCLLASDPFIDFTVAASTGTRMPRTSWGDMCEFPVVIPAQRLLERFDLQFFPLIERIKTSCEYSVHLSLIRDALLPKLISGEIRIPDAERMLEEVGV
jgi:type I restriction enzyme S subunit